MTRELAIQMKEDAYEMMLDAYDQGANWDYLKELQANYRYWKNQVSQFDIQLTLW